jgi:N-acetylglucosamine malate deacetylase 2
MRCLIVAPHPDDETIGAAGWMLRHRDSEIAVLYVTNGSPRDVSDAHAAGFESREDYAAARRGEAARALGLVGIGAAGTRRFDFVDRECYLHLPEFVARMTTIFEELRPGIVLSPAYEGGHPDHDSAAFAVAKAKAGLREPFRHMEYRLYHAAPDGTMDTKNFLPSPSSPVEICPLSDAEQETKSRMFGCFQSQQRFLKEFRLEEERFRDAPKYDFSLPPHDGALLYELWGWGISGSEWRRLAMEAGA